jgi:UV DNA damage endonuclease
MKIGYACINETLSCQKPKVTTNRGMIKKTFQSKGKEYASSLALKNVIDLIAIIRWNHKNNINFYRMSSDIFPWMSEYEFSKLPDYETIKIKLSEAGALSMKYNQRLTFHPGPFNVLCSPREDVVKKTISELNKHSEIMDMMNLSRTHYNKINIHVGGVYGDKISAMNRWIEGFKKLDEGTKSRLTVENDDKASMYSLDDLMYIHNKIGIPIVFDYHHHKLNTGGLSEVDALNLALSTWSDDIKPIVHYSESKALHESDDKIKPQAHSDYINQLPNLYGNDVDVMLEVKKKEIALLNIR